MASYFPSLPDILRLSTSTRLGHLNYGDGNLPMADGKESRSGRGRVRAVQRLLEQHASVTLIYDGDCPICSSYSRALRIRRDLGSLQLINARHQPEFAVDLTERGIDINDGFVCILDGEIYSGVSAIHVLALISGNVGVFNRINYCVFSNKKRASVIYPLLKAGRGALLRILGRRPILT